MLLLSPFADDIVDPLSKKALLQQGAGNPGKYMERFHDAGIAVIPVVGKG